MRRSKNQMIIDKYRVLALLILKNQNIVLRAEQKVNVIMISKFIVIVVQNYVKNVFDYRLNCIFLFQEIS